MVVGEGDVASGPGGSRTMSIWRDSSTCAESTWLSRMLNSYWSFSSARVHYHRFFEL